MLDAVQDVEDLNSDFFRVMHGESGLGGIHDPIQGGFLPVLDDD
jgi:hypothetical protein